MKKIIHKYNFVYLTTNLINGKQYIGDHSVDNLEKDKYFGSGEFIKKSLKKHGVNNFKREILEFFPSKKEAFDAQAPLIKKYNTLLPDGYNYSPTGGLGVCNCYHPDKEVSIETRQKISDANKGKKKPPRTKDHSNKIMKSRKENGYSVWNKGKKMDADFGEKMRMINKGKPSNFKNKIHSEESKKKISNSKKGVEQKKFLCSYCNRYIGQTNYIRFHGDKCKLKNYEN